VRAFSAVVLVAGLVFLAACGGGGTPAGIQITISLSAGATSLNPGQSTTITAAVANDSSNKGVSWAISSGGGTLSNQTSTSVTYTAPASVPTATSATITATSVASPSVMASIQIALQTSSITIALSPLAPQTINQGATVPVTATLTNDTSNKGVTWSISPQVGSLSSPTSTSVTYDAPASVTSNTLVTLTATSVASTATTATLEITVFPSGAGPNVAALTVDAGPAPTTNASANTPYISVTICVPGTQTCQTVDHIEVDTGSSGLRVLQSVIPGLSLPTLTDSSNGDTVFNCVQFLDTSYLWGAVQQADIRIGGEVAGSTYIQTISSSNTGIPAACTNGGTINENTPQLLEANGIIGVGLEPTDCYAQGLQNLCDGSIQAPLPAYFECPSSGCASTDTQITIGAPQQVTNPVALIGADGNGVILQLPAVTSADATVSGALIFGINTAAGNNGLGSAIAFPLSNDSFTTNFSNQALIDSFIDSGSNALFFPSTITVCSDNSSFYCPAGLTAESASNVGAGGSPTSVVTFNVDNADNLFNDNPNDAAFGTLAGPEGTAGSCTPQGTGSCSFDWGLPFFYGRSVFTAIDGATVNNVGTGPFWAY
jgi:hypothetical protein